jgi:hypothetical protein
VSVDPEGRTVAVFRGHLSASDGKASAEAFVAACRRERQVIVLDIREMTSYDSGARQAWVEALKPHRARFERIEVRGGSALVRMGASVVAMLLGIPIDFRGAR